MAVENFGSENVILTEEFDFDSSELVKEGLDIVSHFTVPIGRYPIIYFEDSGRYGFMWTSSTTE